MVEHDQAAIGNRHQVAHHEIPVAGDRGLRVQIGADRVEGGTQGTGQRLAAGERPRLEEEIPGLGELLAQQLAVEPRVEPLDTLDRDAADATHQLERPLEVRLQLAPGPVAAPLGQRLRPEILHQHPALVAGRSQHPRHGYAGRLQQRGGAQETGAGAADLRRIGSEDRAAAVRAHQPGVAPGRHVAGQRPGLAPRKAGGGEPSLQAGLDGLRFQWLRHHNPYGSSFKGPDRLTRSQRANPLWNAGCNGFC
jgi:hypothetical protein